MHHCRGDAGDLIVLENLGVRERQQSADILSFEKIPDVVGSDALVSHGVDVISKVEQFDARHPTHLSEGMFYIVRSVCHPKGRANHHPKNLHRDRYK